MNSRVADPASKGEDLRSLTWIDQFRKMGLKPGNTDRRTVQKVPLSSASRPRPPAGVQKGRGTAPATEKTMSLRGRNTSHQALRSTTRKWSLLVTAS